MEYIWTRAELKEKAKKAFRANYWMVVLVSFLFAAFVSANNGITINYNTGSTGNEAVNFTMNPVDNLNFINNLENNPDMISGFHVTFGTFATRLIRRLTEGNLIMLAVLGLVSIIVLKTFVFNVLEVGCDKFYLSNERDKGFLEELAYGFRQEHYMNIVKIMFCRDLYISLWILCLIIPALVKSYEYQMIPFILADDPMMEKDAVFALTKQMMDGQKMAAFILELSFLGWDILGTFTFGLLNLLWTNPYRYCTEAELYLALQIPQNEPEYI